MTRVQARLCWALGLLLFALLHLAFQLYSLLRSYLTGMAHFDDPSSRQAAWESDFWERVAAVATFPLVRAWEHLPLPWRTEQAVEWSVLALNSLLWAVIFGAAARWVLSLRHSGGGE